MANTATLVIYLVSIWVCYLVASTVWSVYFGALSTIPGPKLAAATRLVLIWKRATGESELWKLELHRKYGYAVRVAPKEISFASGPAWKDIYGPDPITQTAKCPKDPASYGTHDKNASLAVAWDDDHPRQRKCFAHAFSEKTVRQWEPLVQEHVVKLLQNIDQTIKPTESQKFSIDRQYSFLTFDIMGELAWGGPLGNLERQDMDSWVSRIFGSIKMIVLIQELKGYPNIERFLNFITPKSAKKMQRDHFKYSEDRVDKRLAEKSPRFDIWHYVLAAKEKKHELTQQEIYANASIFMIAGTETSATLLTALTYHLLANPDKLKLLTQEIRTKFKSVDEIRTQDLTSLKYLYACVWEAFRIHPPVPIGLQRLVPKGGAEIVGYKLPAGTIVYVHQLSTNRLEKNFTRPSEYLPQRWLSTETANNISNVEEVNLDPTPFMGDDKSAVQPFSIGPRNCIGSTLAWLEIRIIMAQILWHYDLELCDESRNWQQQKIYNFWELNPLWVRAKRAVR